ncbi:MAG TPA: IS66 family transposase, partial [Flavobacteriaceae bacterium]|nr:IS66 family transposase [Flavobacteriaceae bacterium]
MQKALKHLSKEELITLLQNREKESEKKIRKAHHRILDLEFQLAQYKRIVHGQKRERFEGNKNQMTLPFEADPEQVQKQEEEVKE